VPRARLQGNILDKSRAPAAQQMICAAPRTNEHDLSLLDSLGAENGKKEQETTRWRRDCNRLDAVRCGALEQITTDCDFAGLLSEADHLESFPERRPAHNEIVGSVIGERNVFGKL